LFDWCVPAIAHAQHAGHAILYSLSWFMQDDLRLFSDRNNNFGVGSCIGGGIGCNNGGVVCLAA
jgi:hypothetical protein